MFRYGAAIMMAPLGMASLEERTGSLSHRIGTTHRNRNIPAAVTAITLKRKANHRETLLIRTGIDTETRLTVRLYQA